ncbi:MAG: type secretion system baseplate subunit TssG [Rhizobacter sp.]|nr:type secretion system baseplate subunit TssG [Rhizobacter sp.]
MTAALRLDESPAAGVAGDAGAPAVANAPRDAGWAAAQQRDALLQRLAAEPHRFDLFQAMRRIEAAHPEKPRLGDALRPSDEPLRFAQEATLTFAPSAISGVQFTTDRPMRLTQRVFALLGPNGPLPIHLTEYTRDRQLHHADPTVLRFLDVLLHRFGLFFYRAWARAQPAVDLDRPHDAQVARHVGSLIGIADAVGETQDTLGHDARLFFVSRLARSVRDADGLQSWISAQLRVPVRVDQFSGHWMALGVQERSRLGGIGGRGFGGEPQGLGRGVVLGSSVWDVQHKFRIVIGPLAWSDYLPLLPGGGALAQLQLMVYQFVGFEFAWDVQLILHAKDVPPFRLGAQPGVGLLGRTAWLNHPQRRKPAADLVIDVDSLQPLNAPPRRPPHQPRPEGMHP